MSTNPPETPKPGSSPTPTTTTRAIDTVEVIPAALSDEVIIATVAEVNECSRQATLDLSNKLGEVIINRFFAGDLAGWRERGSADASFRKLAAHPDLAVSPSGIYRAVAVYELCDRLVGVAGVKQLAVGHLRAVLGLDEKHQVKLLTSTIKNGWNVETLREEAGKLPARVGDGRGRKPDPAFVKGIRRMGKLLDPDADWFSDLEKVEQLDVEDAEALWKTVTGMKLKCEELQKRLGARVPGFGE